MDGRSLHWLLGVIFVAMLSQNCFLASGICENNPVLQNSYLSKRLEDLFLSLMTPNDERQRDALCTVCVETAAALREAYAYGLPVETIDEIAILVCSELQLFPQDVCDGMVKLEGDRVLYILNATKYDLETVCGFMLRGHCDKRELDPWSLAVPGGKPFTRRPRAYFDNILIVHSQSIYFLVSFIQSDFEPAANTIRILHVTDSHMDLQYDEGSAVNCDYPLCCRQEYGDPQPGDPAAGHWGAEEHCNVPQRTLDELIRQAALLKPDLVYMTGDMSPASVWELTRATNIESVNVTFGLFRRHMPDTPVFSCLGNHEAVPVNSYAIPAAYEAGFNMDWLYESSVALWSPWLPEDTYGDILRGGYFSYSPFPGFRIVSINMNYCHMENWWLLIDSVDPTGQLQWLIDSLGAAEAAGEKVHILAHFPPGGSCVDYFNTHLNKIITRYESTIRAMFHGHTHKDALSLVYDPEDSLRPVAVGFTGPEGSCGEFHQPSFKMYTIDANHDQATWSVIDMQTFSMNMTLSNRPGASPEFVQRYTSQEAYGVQTLTAASVDQLTLNMAADKDLFAQYVRNKQNHYLEPPEMFTCPEDPTCHKNELCGIVNTDHNLRDACHRIEKIIDGGYYF
ncbi:sphingomyelin phosphodiesterase-like [Macrobrachium nipponense]|uniref:sphingomyelin phosphodiesterase-like n=1 Tax=Macrobrachium nipponense TaxID=159736 RepID=UPI0030C7B5DB